MGLKEHLDLLATDIAFWLVGFQDPAYLIEQMGDLSEKLSDQFRTLAIITLLGEGNTDLFYHNLLRSGKVRELFLERARSENFSDFHLAISRNKAFFDVLAAGDFEFARRIVEISPSHWIANGEYEDDFCFIRFCHMILWDQSKAESILKILTQFEASLDGNTDSRWDLCKALFDRDQEAFDESFASYLEDYESHLAFEKERGRMEDPHVLAERRICIEGLGILRIAEALGFKTKETYLFCPSLSRLPMAVPFPGK